MNVDFRASELNVGRIVDFVPSLNADMAFISELTPSEIWERLEKRAYHWNSREERLKYWGNYGFFYKRLCSGGFQIIYTRDFGYYDAMNVKIKEIPSGSLLLAKAPFLHKNSDANDAAEMIEIHLLREED